jgi:hypothetical protein
MVLPVQALREGLSAARRELLEMRERTRMLRSTATQRRTSAYHPVQTGIGKSADTAKYGLQQRETQRYGRDPMAAMPQETIVDRFAYALAYRGLTPAQLALRAGDSGRTTVLRYVRGDVAVYRQDIVARYADALGCDAVWLLLGRGEPGWAPDWKP